MVVGVVLLVGIGAYLTVKKHKKNKAIKRARKHGIVLPGDALPDNAAQAAAGGGKRRARRGRRWLASLGKGGPSPQAQAPQQQHAADPNAYYTVTDTRKGPVQVPLPGAGVPYDAPPPYLNSRHSRSSHSLTKQLPAGF